MDNMTVPKERKSRLIVVGVLLILSLVAAVVLFYFLDSFAQVQNRTVSLGGAAAGFVVIFYLLRNTYFRVPSTDIVPSGKSKDEEIEILKNLLKKAIASKLDNFVVPEGYKDEVSQEFQFGFCYPQDWEFSRFPQITVYGAARDSKSAEKPGIARNVTVVVTDMSNDKRDLNEIYENGVQSVLLSVPNAELVSKKELLFQGLPAMKYRANYVTNDGRQLTLDQTAVADKERNNLYHITFSTTQENFDSSKGLFENIASTFRI